MKAGGWAPYIQAPHLQAAGTGRHKAVSDATKQRERENHMMDEIIAALRALANIFDLISRNFNKRK